MVRREGSAHMECEEVADRAQTEDMESHVTGDSSRVGIDAVLQSDENPL